MSFKNDEQIMKRPPCEVCCEYPALVLVGDFMICGECLQRFNKKQKDKAKMLFEELK